MNPPRGYDALPKPVRTPQERRVELIVSTIVVMLILLTLTQVGLWILWSMG